MPTTPTQTTDLTVSYQQPVFNIDLTPVDVTLQFNAAGAGPEGAPGETGPPGQSITGPQGPVGPQGISGQSATVDVGATVTLAPGAPAQVTNSGTPLAGIFNFGVPQGQPGAGGVAGSAATITAGSTTTGAPGSSATVTNSGSSSAAIFDFVIPQGAVGPQGPPGGASANTTLTATFTMPATGSTAVATVANASAFGIGVVAFVQGLGYLSTTAVNTGTNQLTLQNLGYSTNAAPGSTAPSTTPLTGVGPQGPSGPAGSAATISVGTTTTGAPGTNANVTQTGTPQNSTLNFTIPAGVQGPGGATGSPGLPGATGSAATIAVGTTTTGAPGTNATVTNAGTANAAIFNFTIPAGVAGTPGVGDMTKAVYDPDNSGIVETADTANAVPWTGVTGVPTSFTPIAHAPTHNLGGSDAIAPDWTQVQNKPTQFAPAPHAPTHVSGGTDVIALASTSASGLLNQLSGNATDYVNGQNACQPLAPQIWSVRLRSFNSVGNCSFEVDQRNVGTLVANPAAGSFSLDRWSVTKVGTMVLATQQSSVPISASIVVPGTSFKISSNFLAATLTTTEASLAAGDLWCFNQQIEGPLLREIVGDVSSLSLLVASTVAGLKFSVAIRDPGTVTKSLVKLCTIPSSGWTLIQLPNVPLFPSGNFSVTPGTAGYQLSICLACGTTYTAPAADAWQNGNFVGAPGMSNFAGQAVNSVFQVAFVQHEPGSQCTQLIDKPFTQNYDECLRYFQKSYTYAQAVGNTTGVASLQFIAQASLNPIVPIRFPKIMAKTPTLTAYSSTTGAANNIRDVNASLDKAVTGTINLSDSGYSGFTVSTPNSAVWNAQWHHTADAGW